MLTSWRRGLKVGHTHHRHLINVSTGDNLVVFFRGGQKVWRRTSRWEEFLVHSEEICERHVTCMWLVINSYYIPVTMEIDEKHHSLLLHVEDHGSLSDTGDTLCMSLSLVHLCIEASQDDREAKRPQRGHSSPTHSIWCPTHWTAWPFRYTCLNLTPQTTLIITLLVNPTQLVYIKILTLSPLSSLPLDYISIQINNYQSIN